MLRTFNAIGGQYTQLTLGTVFSAMATAAPNTDCGRAGRNGSQSNKETFRKRAVAITRGIDSHSSITEAGIHKLLK